jgi:hypothetical protein
MTAPPNRDLCTYFDKNYLSRGLTLYHSLRAHLPSFRLFVLCLDQATKDYLTAQALPGIVAVSRSELEAHDPALVATRPTRTLIEYYFTSTPCWLKCVFDRFPDIELLTYLDADFRFFSSPEPLFAEMGSSSIAVVEHRFPPALRYLEDRGRFNVGWLSFRRDAEGLACLAWWRERCVEWCYDRLESDRFADQKYLDQWPHLFRNLVVLQHKGVNVAPWNLDDTRFHVDGAVPMIDEQPLICFHYHGFKHVVGPLFESGLWGYPVKLNSLLRSAIFAPYVSELLQHEAALERAGIATGTAKSLRYLTGGLRGLAQRTVRSFSALLSGTCIWAPRAARQ